MSYWSVVGALGQWSVIDLVDGFKGDSINEYFAIFESHLQS